jgi:hypothetical protein
MKIAKLFRSATVAIAVASMGSFFTPTPASAQQSCSGVWSYYYKLLNGTCPDTCAHGTQCPCHVCTAPQ